MADAGNKPSKSIRWWLGLLILALAVGAAIWARAQDNWAFQKRNLAVAQIAISTGILLLIWWTFLSRAPTRLRLAVTAAAIGAILILAALFRVRGMSGDMLPILEPRWTRRALPLPAPATPTVETPNRAIATTASFPQFLGPNRNGVLPGPKLEPDWKKHPPEVLWRIKIGAAWSGFVVVGNLALTQEQRGVEECVVAYAVATGREVWRHADQARYNTVIAGDGPRATPTVAGERVFTFGATGILNCLELATGRRIWTRDLVTESGGKMPQWGGASSPLVVNDLVISHGGEDAPKSLFAFQVTDGKPAWSSGTTGPGYAAPVFVTLAGVPQVIAFNDGTVSGHDPATGTLLWDKAWGNGNVVCSTPVVVSTNRVLFSSGYGVGAELLEISPAARGKFTARVIWKSIRMKAKFSHLYARDGFLYGLDDGMFACVDLADGAQRWKEGRHGHGQGLAVGEYYLLMAEAGDLLLLKPTPVSPTELARFRVLDSKTWNPIALAGDLLLVRNDQEAVCLRLKTNP